MFLPLRSSQGPSGEEEEESGGGKVRRVGGSQGQTSDSRGGFLFSCTMDSAFTCPYCGMRLGIEYE